MQDREWKTEPAPNAEQAQICFDRDSYSAFPHVVRLEGDELLLAFRQAPREEKVRHAHARSIITLIRSYDAGATWDIANASQMAAGGGQELSLICFGDGHVAGALAWHEVVSVRDMARAGFPRLFPHEPPFRTPGTYWAWSDTYGLTWRPDHVVFVGPGTMPCGPPHMMHDGTLLCPVYSFREDTAPSGIVGSLLYRSCDEGRSWSGPVVMAAGAPLYCEPCVIETEPGVLRALHRVEGLPECNFWSNASRDGGVTWSEPEDTGILSGACPRLLGLADGRLLLTFGRRFPPYGIRAMLSEDGGASWGDTAWILRTVNSGNQGYTSSLELGNGRILTTCYAEDEEGTTGIIGTFWDLPG